MSLVIRLGTAPLRLLGKESLAEEQTIQGSVVGGIRSGAYLKDVSSPVASVGVVLKAGAAHALFGVSSSELAESHTGLDALWGSRAAHLADELASRSSLSARIDRLEGFLTQALPTVRGIHPGIARVLDDEPVRTDRTSLLASRAGLGPRRFAQVFRETVGVSPKRWLRLQRFRSVVAKAAEPDVDWADLAQFLGYSDQPHLSREFREFSGLTPGEYQRLKPTSPSHVPHASESPFSSRQK